MKLHHALSADFRVLSKLRSNRFSLQEVVASVRSSRGADTTPGRLRRRQLMRIRRGRTDRHTEAFLDRQPAEATSPLFVPLLSKRQQLYAITDIELAKAVLMDPETFNRARTLESFADAFRLNSVFTTKDAGLHKELKAFFTAQTNRLSDDVIEANKVIFERHVDEMLRTFEPGTSVRFVPRVEGLVLAAYGEAFFGMKSFPNAEECAVLIKEIWQIKSLRNNAPGCRYNPRLLAQLRWKQRRLFSIIEHAQSLVDRNGSEAARSMAEVYGAHGYAPGNLLNAFIPLYEAVARGLVFAMMEFADAPDVRDQLREEILRNSNDDSAYCAATDTLLERAWCETLRLRPPTPNQTRRVTIADHPLFAEDSKVVIVWGGFHRDRDVWGADADLFRPDRWLETTSAQRRNYNPFGSGAQACVAKHYASHGGRVMIKRILDRSEFGFVKPAATTDDVGTDRGYFRGPDPDTALLRFTPRRA